ncbi:hypothetical protein ScPMuIL_013380 [Solemya velum]
MQSSLSEIESVVNGSARVNIAQLVGWEDGTSLVPVRDWQSHLGSNGKILKGIKQYHHFRFDSAEPGWFLPGRLPTAQRKRHSGSSACLQICLEIHQLSSLRLILIYKDNLNYLTIYASLCQTNGKTLCALTLRQPQ